jgi:hypothetical protein
MLIKVGLTPLAPPTPLPNVTSVPFHGCLTTSGTNCAPQRSQELSVGLASRTRSNGFPACFGKSTQHSLFTFGTLCHNNSLFPCNRRHPLQPCPSFISESCTCTFPFVQDTGRQTIESRVCPLGPFIVRRLGPSFWLPFFFFLHVPTSFVVHPPSLYSDP